MSQSSGTAQMKLPLLSNQPVWNGKVAADLTTEEADAYATAQRREIMTNVGVVFDLSGRAEQETYALLDLDGDGTAEKLLLPSFLIILAIALFFHNFKDNTIVERIFKGIRPAVVALIAAPTFSMAKSARINRYNIWIPVVSALLIWLLGFSPVWIIIAAGVGGYCFGRFQRPKN